MKRAAALALVLLGCGGPRTVLRPNALRGVERVCLADAPSTAPVDVVAGVHSEIEVALLRAGVEAVPEGPCEIKAEIVLVWARPWVFGWLSDGLIVNLRRPDGSLTGSIEYATPGGTYIAYVLKPFAAEVEHAFKGKR